MTIGVILAGGRATRLGPLGAQVSKCLVTFGQRPLLAWHVEALLEAGCEDIIVVTSPANDAQVAAVIERAALPCRTVVQPKPEGPADAISLALITASSLTHDVLLLLADSFIEGRELRALQVNEVAVAPAPTTRSWCHWDDSNQIWYDERVDVGESVAVGAYRFDYMMLRAATLVKWEGMGQVINSILPTPEPRTVTSWLDFGDLQAIAHARRQRFIGRAKHSITMDENGVLTKRGIDQGEAIKWMAARQNAPVSLLYPQVTDVITRTDDKTCTVKMEYVDLPTLAELWCWWPGGGEFWSTVFTQWHAAMSRIHWPRLHQPVTYYDALQMYVSQPRERLAREHPELTVALRDAVWDRSLVETAWNWSAYVHGDPNFSNVLWSLSSGTFKLLDPRGTWGSLTHGGDKRYDIAKFMYSMWWAPVVHGLDPHKLDRDAEQAALWQTVADHGYNVDDIKTLCAVLLASGSVLHPDDEAEQLRSLAWELIK